MTWSSGKLGSVIQNPAKQFSQHTGDPFCAGEEDEPYSWDQGCGSIIVSTAAYCKVVPTATPRYKLCPGP